MSEKGEIYCLWDEPYGVWLAFQVLKPFGEPKKKPDEDQIDKLNRSSTGIIMLDWFSEKFPDEKDISEMKEFRRNDGDMKGLNIESYIDGDIPTYCKHAGCKEPVHNSAGGGYGRLSNTISALEYSLRWEKTPEKYHEFYSRKNYIIKSAEDLNTISDKLNPVELTFCEYVPENLGDVMKRFPLTSKLIVMNCRYHGRLDLSGTYLDELCISVDNIDELILPDTLRTLHINGKPEKGFSIKAFEQGRRITLRAEGAAIYLKGMERCHVYEQVLSADEHFDIEKCSECYCDLYGLFIWGEFGTINGFSHLKQFKHLREFLCTGVYEFSGEDFPFPEDLPELGELSVFDVPKEALDVIKKRWKSVKPLDKYLRCGRTEEWLRENRDNPLRMWQGRENIPLSKAKHAAKLYKEMRKSAFELADSNNLPELEELFKKYSEKFYALDKKCEFLETVELEELYLAVETLIDEIEKHTGKSTDRENLLKWYDGMF